MERKMNQLKEFVTDYFKANNAKVLESKKQITIQIPKRLSAKLNCEQILNITFDKELAEKNPDIDFIAIGSALLNKILESCEKRGLTIVKQYKGKNKFEGLEFDFRVTFESIDKKEKLINYLITLKDKKFNDKLLKELEKKDFEEGEEITLNPEIATECYNKCIEQLEKDIKGEVSKINQKLRKALDKEKNIIEKFYDGIIADLKKKQEDKKKIYQEKMEKAKNAQYVEVIEEHRKERDKYREKLLELQDKQYEELTNYFNLKERRLAEIDNQFKLNTKISLVSAALVRVV
jgi:hypothetical protein